MDQQVLATQKWLNKTYDGVKGFEKVPENGQTGWPTIYGLREGLQHELKITDLGEGFGDKTKDALSKVIGSIKEGTKSNIVQLIKGAFWCKGISPVSFDDNYDKDLTDAIKELQSDAGITADGILSVNLMAALFDMAAFTLVEGGDKKVREMQQALNKQYSDDLGVLPCDGVYQRGTNTALIYALQRTIGMDASTANGNYGPGTISRTPTVEQGQTGEIVRIIQYGLYVNGFYKGDFDGVFSDAVSASIINFRKFMKLPPYTGTADLTVIKGLLTSNGNTDRDSVAFDTATQLNASAITKFKNAGFNIVGRYLTGTVGVGKNERPKYLTTDEIKLITDGGLSIFPLYEDGGYEEKYFTASQGRKDGVIAMKAARKLGFPSGTTIYFAVDVDIQDGDIEGTVIPYLQGVQASMASSEYHVGVYGTRNVCLHAETYGIKYSFVSDMSYGWSGNLGFKMPENWSFDQFTEYTAGSTGIDIDQDAASGKDNGASEFSPVGTVSPETALNELIPNVSLELDQEKVLLNEEWVKVTATASESVENSNGSGVVSIKNGKIDSVNLSDYLSKLGGVDEGQVKLIVQQEAGLVLSQKIKNGQLSLSTSATAAGMFTVKLAWTVFETDAGVLTENITIALNIKFNMNQYPNSQVQLNTDGETVSEFSNKMGLALEIGAGIALTAALAPYVGTLLGGSAAAETGSSIIASVATAVLAFFKGISNSNNKS